MLANRQMLASVDSTPSAPRLGHLRGSAYKDYLDAYAGWIADGWWTATRSV
ncbi:hypothetical protein GCM10020220_090110 [Nonomuraea rubra]|uniref:hypothetical protein n=1 Tax=Nonomuraea rubra TaxID=46180 RepID=UPI0031EE85DB